MKNIRYFLTAVLSVFFVFNETYSQTNTFPSSGSVGIGTISPLSKLEIRNGDLLIKNLSNNTGNSAIMINHSINYGDLITYGTSLRTYVEDQGSNTYALQFFTQKNWNNGQTEKMRISGNGYVGIGTPSPSQKLTIYDNNKSAIEFKRGSASGRIEQNSSGGALRLQDLNNNTIIQLRTYGDSYFNGGKVGIGTNNPDSDLSVNGLITTKEIKVDINGWPDYVFSDDYALMDLFELNQYLTKNKHLPEIPKAAEVEEEGLALGEMNKLLLKKIEELTLYLIQQNKKISLMENEIKFFKKTIIAD